MINELKNNKNFFIVEKPFRAMSVFDHIRYDRSDYDILSPPQRHYVIKELLSLGGVQLTGRRVAFKESASNFIFPKANAMSQSPGDVLLELTDEGQDYLVLTPTQMAFAIIKKVSEQSVKLNLLKDLILKQPINLKKVIDYADNNEMKDFLAMFAQQLSDFQTEVVGSEQMRNRKHLGSFV